MLTLLKDVFYSNPISLTVTTIVAVLIWNSFFARLFAPVKSFKMIPGWISVVGHFHLIGKIRNMPGVFEYWAEKYGDETGCFEVDTVGI